MRGEGSTSCDVCMVRHHLDEVPENPLPEGYAFRNLGPNEGGVWKAIWEDADGFEFGTSEDWASEFMGDAKEVEKRCIVVLDRSGRGVSTGSAWRIDIGGEDVGRVHWLATKKAHQRKGIGKALLSEILERLSHWHSWAFLRTQYYRAGAIRMYLDSGFEPLVSESDSLQVWIEIQRKLRHPDLDAFLKCPRFAGDKLP